MSLEGCIKVSIAELLLHAEMTPFTIALALVIGLLLIELFGVLLGVSVLGAGGAEADADFDADFDTDFDLDADAAFETEADLGAEDAAEGPSDALAGGWLSWLGVGRAPLMIWIAGVLTGFGVAGYMLQTLTAMLFGGLAPVGIAVVLALLPGLAFGATFARWIARLAPKLETAAVSERHLGGVVGVIAQGQAARGRPAQARVKDRHGETHHIRVEPIDDTDVLTAGEDVVVLRARDGAYRAMRLEDRPASPPVQKKG